MVPGVSIAAVHCCGKLRKTDEEKTAQKARYSAASWSLTELDVELDSDNDYSAGTALERATLLSFALTKRNFNVVWAARGGMGATTLLPHLIRMLPPALPEKTLIGFSDFSFLGVLLSHLYPTLKYVHTTNAFDELVFNGRPQDVTVIAKHVSGNAEDNHSFSCTASHNVSGQWKGVCIPINLSLAESLCAVKGFSLDYENIVFLEDVDEEQFRINRKMDSLINSGFFKNTTAIVLGEFKDCRSVSGDPVSEERIAEVIARFTGKPTFVWKEFGHGEARFPLVAHAPVVIEAQGTRATLTLSSRKCTEQSLRTLPQNATQVNNAYFMGIGGTGMAAVAGLFKSAGYTVTGSDGPIYPPMSTVLEKLEIKPFTAYHPRNLDQTSPDFVVLSNVITRKNAKLQKNEEFEALLKTNLPMFSFPSALRHCFLQQSVNVVVSGTHGKTTTSSMIAHILTELGHAPSFMIGGSPKNFELGFALRSKDLFVLEGDEYDSALFDKGPKFLHYEPTVALVNNIEFDHADIYENVEAIEAEFSRLCTRTLQRGGTIVANASDARVKKICRNVPSSKIIWFGNEAAHTDGRLWKVENVETHADGSLVSIRTPEGHVLTVRSGVFGIHNALNISASLAVLEALTSYIPQHKAMGTSKWPEVFGSFKGVKRRFELLGIADGIAVFDDFAHHPTAVKTTLEAFRSYLNSARPGGRLVVCFDPRNATMRRNIFQTQLAESLSLADRVYIGKVMEDQRIPAHEAMNGPQLAKQCRTEATYCESDEDMLKALLRDVKKQDTVVFMSSGSFDQLPKRFFDSLNP